MGLRFRSRLKLFPKAGLIEIAQVKDLPEGLERCDRAGADGGRVASLKHPLHACVL